MYHTMDACDEYLISWIGWEYKKYAGSLAGGTCTGCGYGLWHQDGTLDTNVAKGVSRTYAQKVAGQTLSARFNWQGAVYYTLRYTIDTEIREPTVIYFNQEYWYPNGVEVSVSPSGNQLVTYQIIGSYLELYNTDDANQNGGLVEVNVTAKA